MKRIFRNLLITIGALWGTVAQAQPAAIPPNILSNNNLPMVMLNASKDFTMFWKAYTDFDDIDFDGVVDRTYMPAFKYYGYFDPAKCYTYNASYNPGTSAYSPATGRFEPSRIADVESGKYYCTGSSKEWSGNFLNWISMSRLDVLRKVLYGGMRSADTSGATTLELSFVPRNSQAFVKYYNGNDLNRLTPFTSTNAMAKGVTFCRRPAENSGTSQSSILTPEIRAAVGNLLLWNMTEILSCNWSSEVGYSWQTPTINFLNANYQTPVGDYGSANSNHAHLTSVPAKSGENTSFVARVQVCASTLLGTEKCKNYGTSSSPAYKPIGLLQEFGESASSGTEAAKAEFGLMMGSYDNNLRGGVLRKNMGQINDEIDSATGVFITPASGTGGIIKSFNEITLYGYDLASGNYADTCFSDSITNGSCPSWGNPVSELLLESLRYFAGKSPLYSPGTKDSTIGLPAVTSWSDPLTSNPTIGSSTRAKLYGQPICRPLNMLTVTSGSSSFDDDDLVNFSQIQPTTTYTAAGLTKTIGDKEGITGTIRLVGLNGGTTTAEKDQLCTGKTITDLGKVSGVCADGPNFRGTYLGSGMAYYANTNAIRNDFTSTSIPKDVSGHALMVRQYGVSMSGGVATIAVPVGSGQFVYITPASQDQLGGHLLPGNLVDFKILSRSADGKSGAALALWQHNMLGEDQDQDQLQSLRWVLNDSTSTLKVYTQAVEANSGSTAPLASGYTLVGTNADGVHLHSSINNYATTETGLDVSLALYSGTTTGSPGSGCTIDTITSYPRSLCVYYSGKYYRGETGKSYTVTGARDALIREPLWYMSKYGGFKYDKKTYTGLWPDSSNLDAWDVKRADGKACGGVTGLPCNDGEPDNYFVARSPELLESSLREILEDIVNSANTSPAIASSQLRAGDLKYVARFEPSDGHGELSAYAIDEKTGLFLTKSVWDAHPKLADSITRPVVTNSGSSGIQFQYNSLDSAKQTVLKSGISDATVATAYAKSMMQWLRGDTTNKSQFRVRASNSVMGALVNSNPTVEVPPAANFFGSNFAGYGDFVNKWSTRPGILWVGSGDGMLHGFNASSAKSGGGTPIISYIPEPVFANLPNWANPTTAKVQAFVDGSPFVGDITVGATWSTYLFSSLGRGGKGMFALDVTDPAVLADETKASNIFKWQFTSADDTTDLGYIISEPTVSRFSGQSGQIARMNNGKFAALFGNGVMSPSGKAVLYILFADGPSAGSWSGRYVKIVADPGPGNALSQPIWVDENNDGVADTIYAGDLKGNLWKFDVSNADSTKWGVAYSGKPLFTAKDSAGTALPITSAPEFRFHPMGGQMLIFATGKSYESGDFPNTSRTNAIFGIWDKPVFKTTVASSLDSTLPRTLSQLQARTFNNVSSSTTDRYVSGSVIDWSTKLGWYLPFNVSSEMSVSNAAMVNSQVAIVSVAPAPTTSPEPCYPTPQARITVVDAITGLPGSALLGTTVVGSTTYWLASISISDQKVRISRDAVGTGTNYTTGSCGNGTLNCSRIVGDKTDTGVAGANTNARIFWREIPGLKTNP